MHECPALRVLRSAHRRHLCRARRRVPDSCSPRLKTTVNASLNGASPSKHRGKVPRRASSAATWPGRFASTFDSRRQSPAGHPTPAGGEALPAPHCRLRQLAIAFWSRQQLLFTRVRSTERRLRAARTFCHLAISQGVHTLPRLSPVQTPARCTPPLEIDAASPSTRAGPNSQRGGCRQPRSSATSRMLQG